MTRRQLRLAAVAVVLGVVTLAAVRFADTRSPSARTETVQTQERRLLMPGFLPGECRETAKDADERIAGICQGGGSIARGAIGKDGRRYIDTIAVDPLGRLPTPSPTPLRLGARGN